MFAGFFFIIRYTFCGYGKEEGEAGRAGRRKRIFCLLFFFLKKEKEIELIFETTDPLRRRLGGVRREKRQIS